MRSFPRRLRSKWIAIGLFVLLQISLPVRDEPLQGRLEDGGQNLVVGDVTDLESGRARVEMGRDVVELAVVEVVDHDHEVVER